MAHLQVRLTCSMPLAIVVKLLLPGLEHESDTHELCDCVQGFRHSLDIPEHSGVSCRRVPTSGASLPGCSPCSTAAACTGACYMLCKLLMCTRYCSLITTATHACLILLYCAALAAKPPVLCCRTAASQPLGCRCCTCWHTMWAMLSSWPRCASMHRPYNLGATVPSCNQWTVCTSSLIPSTLYAGARVTPLPDSDSAWSIGRHWRI
jgi:hypothetical protein